MGCSAPHVGPVGPNATLVPSGQIVRPAGESVQFGGRPVDLALSPDGKLLFAKDDRGIVVVNTAAWKVKQELSMSGGTSLHGIVLSPDGRHLYATDASSGLHEGEIAEDGKLAWKRSLAMPKPTIGGDAYPVGLAMLGGGRLAVALSRTNAVAIVDLASWKTTATIPVEVAPYGVTAMADGRLLVSCWAARPRTGAKTASSAGTEVEVDERGIGTGGVVCVVDLKEGKVDERIPVGLQPTEILVAGDTAYVAEANADRVSMIDLKKERIKGSVTVKPDAKLPFGSSPNALALVGDKLYVACGGNDAVAQVSLGRTPKVTGFIPAAWYPSALLVHGQTLYIANAKGIGSRGGKATGVANFAGTIQRVALPSAAALKEYTKQVVESEGVSLTLRARERTARAATKPVPVPARLGDPSTIEHVVYVLKENRTYDQLLGDLEKGERDPKLCIYGEEVTPNLHALVRQFALLDNYYCNGVNSADGHAWSMEGNATDYFEKTFGGWTRSYPYGDDPLSPSSSGFVWDAILGRGLSFRNYGEFDYAETVPKGLSHTAVLKDFETGSPKVGISQNIGVERLRNYSCKEYPGWNLNIPDVRRADIFLKELAGFEKNGGLPSFTIVYLPCDHTSGTGPGGPSPRSQVADNDLALGQVIEGISKSRFWAKTCIFVVEDDPQAGFDHIDGHRSICLAVSPYTAHGAVVSDFYSGTSVLHTMLRMLGVVPMNQEIARSSLMTACFTPTPDLTPYKSVPNRIPLDEVNPSLKSLSGASRELALQSMKVPLDRPDQGSDDLKNRVLWNAAKPGQPYPSAWAGAHGKGLGRRGLKLNGQPVDDDD